MPEPSFEPPSFEPIEAEFNQTLADCERLYRSAAEQALEHHPGIAGDSPQSLRQLMDDLGKGLVMKIYSTVAQADRRWSAPEARLAEIIFEKLWGQRLTGGAEQPTAGPIAGGVWRFKLTVRRATEYDGEGRTAETTRAE